MFVGIFLLAQSLSCRGALILHYVTTNVEMITQNREFKMHIPSELSFLNEYFILMSHSAHMK